MLRTLLTNYHQTWHPPERFLGSPQREQAQGFICHCMSRLVGVLLGFCAHPGSPFYKTCSEPDFEVTEEQIASVVANIDDLADQSKVIDALKDQALLRKGQAIARQSEAIIAQMMGQRCSRLMWADSKDLKMKDEAEQEMATPARVRTAPLSNVRPV